MAASSVIALLLAVLFALPAHAQDCFGPTDNAAVEAVLARADAAGTHGDETGFSAAVQEARAFVLPCMGEPITAPVAAHLHTVEGFAAFLDRQRPFALSAMRAARMTWPAFEIDTALLPTGHELRQAFEDAPTEPTGPTVRVPRPKDAILYFDGLPSRLRPVERPTVVQLQDGAGTMLRTAYLRPGEPMIAYQTAPRTRTALAITAGVSAAIFGALFGSSFGVRSAYFRTDSSDGATLDRLRTTTNALAATGIAFGAVALGTGVGAAAVGPR